VLGGGGGVGVALEDGVDVVEVGIWLGLGPLVLPVPVFGLHFLTTAQAQALAGPAEGELDAGQALFADALGEQLAGNLHELLGDFFFRNSHKTSVECDMGFAVRS